MKIGIFFTGSGPLVILTTYDSLTNPQFVTKLSSKGIKKFIAYEVPEKLVRERYGVHFDAVLNDLHQDDDARVIDFDGHNIFNHFSLKELGNPVLYE
ncbi:MAG: hypothetical protein WC061_03705 [Melioribacteraceae bacterium]